MKIAPQLKRLATWKGQGKPRVPKLFDPFLFDPRVDIELLIAPFHAIVASSHERRGATKIRAHNSARRIIASIDGRDRCVRKKNVPEHGSAGDSLWRGFWGPLSEILPSYMRYTRVYAAVCWQGTDLFRILRLEGANNYPLARERVLANPFFEAIVWPSSLDCWRDAPESPVLADQRTAAEFAIALEIRLAAFVQFEIDEQIDNPGFSVDEVLPGFGEASANALFARWLMRASGHDSLTAWLREKPMRKARIGLRTGRRWLSGTSLAHPCAIQTLPAGHEQVQAVGLYRAVRLLDFLLRVADSVEQVRLLPFQHTSSAAWMAERLQFWRGHPMCEPKGAPEPR